ncbi:MAG TPA: DUF2249 domain-containing protein [Steroidobacteraceae bacterium]|nr:DUF2249 domain-containing protein [Steroidobacteraceae bacterium]
MILPCRPADAHEDVITLDLRELPAPEPMLRVLAALEYLRPDQTLLARTPIRPEPLLAHLRSGGYAVDVVVAAAGDAEVRIWRNHGCAGD